MELGFVSAILPDLTLEEVFSVGRATGYECVEVMCWPPGKAERRYAGVTHIDVSKLDQGEASRILDSAAAHGMKISSLGYYPNLLSPIAGEASVAADHLRNVIRAARKLSISIVNTFIGRDWTRSLEENWPRFLCVWRDLVSFATDQGSRLALRTARCYLPPTNGLAVRILQLVRRYGDVCSRIFRVNISDSMPGYGRRSATETNPLL